MGGEILCGVGTEVVSRVYNYLLRFWFGVSLVTSKRRVIAKGEKFMHENRTSECKGQGLLAKKVSE